MILQTQGKASKPNLIQVYIVGQEEVDEEEDDDDEALLSGWTLTKLDKGGFELELDIPSPLKISSGDLPDLLLIQLEFSEFKDASGQSL